MRFLQNTKTICFQGPAVIATNATSSAYVDTLGYRYAKIAVVSGPATNTSSSAQWTSLRALHGAVTNISSATAIATLTGTTNTTATTAQFLLGEHNDTLVGSVTNLYIDCQSLERYLFIEKEASSAGWATTTDVIELAHAPETPDTLTLKGLAGQGFFP